MPQITTKEQSMLSAARVAVVGAGGLGSPVLIYLAAAGVGALHIIDEDTVALSNLNRQFLHFEEDIGRLKTDSAKNKLSRFNSEIKITTSAIKLDEMNISAELSGSDIIVSCVDNYNTRRLMNAFCVRQKLSMMDGGILGFSGYVMLVLPGETPCYSCVYPETPQNVGKIGVLGATAGVVGAMMAAQTVKYLIGIREGFKFTFIDLLSFTFDTIEIKKNPDCPVCGGK
jgi:adenylyltransferase/sulfurtransferase